MRGGTSRWVYVIVPILPGGMSRPLAALAGAMPRTGTVLSGVSAAAAAAPAPAMNPRRLILLWAIMSVPSFLLVSPARRAVFQSLPSRWLRGRRYGTPTPAPPNPTQLRLKELVAGPPGTGRNTR